MSQETIKGPIAVSVSFYFKMPKSWSKKKREKYYNEPRHHSKPDLSNLIKFFEDALNGIVWEDDALISSIFAEKYWSDEDKTLIVVGYE